MGALAARQETLRTLIAANRDHSSVADSFERELNALERATHAIVDAKYVD